MSKSLNFSTSLKITSIAVLFLVGFLFCSGFDLRAGEIEKNFDDYLKTLSPDEYVSAIVIMADQADIKSLNAELKK